MASALVLGSTGKTGSAILSTLLSLPSSTVASVETISRRLPPQSNQNNSTPSPNAPKFTARVEQDTSKWETLVNSAFPGTASSSAPRVMFSALATTRGAAGSFEKQYVLEHDLNIALAKAARLRTDAPVGTYVLISSGGASSSSSMPYLRLKGDIERDIIELDFSHTVILRPGVISGPREESRPAEAVLRWIAGAMGAISGGLLKDFWAQDGDVIARAAVRAGLKAGRNEFPEKVTILGGKQILELGREPLTEQEKQGS